MLAMKDDARNNDSDSISTSPPESFVRPRLRFESWDSGAFEAWESSFDRAYRPPPPPPAPSRPALQVDERPASEARQPIEELEDARQPTSEVEEPTATAPEADPIPPPPSTLRGLAPSEPRIHLPSLVTTDQWPALVATCDEAEAEEAPAPSTPAPSTPAPSASPSVPPVVLAAETAFDWQPEERPSEGAAKGMPRARARRVRTWVLAAASVLVAPGLVGLVLTAAGAGRGSAPAHATRSAHEVEITISPLVTDARAHARRPAAPAKKAKPGRRSSKHRRR